jgi:hypothetical protein
MKKFLLIAFTLMLVGGVTQAEVKYTIGKMIDSYYMDVGMKETVDRDIKNMGQGIFAVMTDQILNKQRPSFCLPGKTRVSQIPYVAAFFNYVAKYPKTRSEPLYMMASYLHAGIKEIFPCK